MPDPTFANLLARARKRDLWAENDLVRRFEPEVLRYVRSLLGRWKLGHLLEPEDVCQPAFAEFFAKLSADPGGFAEPEQVARFLARAARHRLIDEMRKGMAARRGGGLSAATNADDSLGLAAGNTGTPSGVASGNETIAAVHRLLAPDEKELAARRAAGDEWERIAADLGGTAEALRKKYARAIERVLAELNGPPG